MSGTRIAWRRASRGLSFIVFGVFLLLSTQGLLHPGFWLDALTYWPVVLIALGVRLMFERSRTPWATLLSPVVILATLSFVAWSGAEPLSEDWQSVEAIRSTPTEAWSLDVRTAMTELDVRVGSVARNRYLQGRMAPTNQATVRVSDRDGSSRVYLSSRRWRSGTRYLTGSRNRWDLELTEDLPMTLRLATAFTEGDLALGTVAVTRVDVDGAFNDITLRLGVPSVDTRLDLEGAFNRFELVVPENVPVRVSTDGFVNLVDRRSGTRTSTGPAYRLRTEGAFNRVVIRSE